MYFYIGITITHYVKDNTFKISYGYVDYVCKEETRYNLNDALDCAARYAVELNLYEQFILGKIKVQLVK